MRPALVSSSQRHKSSYTSVAQLVNPISTVYCGLSLATAKATHSLISYNDVFHLFAKLDTSKLSPTRIFSERATKLTATGGSLHLFLQVPYLAGKLLAHLTTMNLADVTDLIIYSMQNCHTNGKAAAQGQPLQHSLAASRRSLLRQIVWLT